MLTDAGLQVPAIPLSDVVGKAGTVPSAQIVSDVPKSNEGVRLGLTVTVKVIVVAQIPASGVKV